MAKYSFEFKKKVVLGKICPLLKTQKTDNNLYKLGSMLTNFIV